MDAFTNADQLSQTGRLNGINMTSASNIATVQQTNVGYVLPLPCSQDDVPYILTELETDILDMLYVDF